MKVKNQKTGKIEDLRLPEEFKNKWLEALRNGKFKQGTGRLHDKSTDRYCCLGVALRTKYPNADFEGFTFINTDKIKIPNILRNRWNNPIVDSLISMNDKERSFKYIAKWIERYL